jgi:hypothetical protein
MDNINILNKHKLKRQQFQAWYINLIYILGNGSYMNLMY